MRMIIIAVVAITAIAGAFYLAGSGQLNVGFGAAAQSVASDSDDTETTTAPAAEQLTATEPAPQDRPSAQQSSRRYTETDENCLPEYAYSHQDW